MTDLISFWYITKTIIYSYNEQSKARKKNKGKIFFL